MGGKSLAPLRFRRMSILPSMLLIASVGSKNLVVAPYLRSAGFVNRLHLLGHLLVSLSDEMLTTPGVAAETCRCIHASAASGCWPDESV